MMKFLKDTGFIPLTILALAAISSAFVPTFTPTKLLTVYDDTADSVNSPDDGCATGKCVYDGTTDYGGTSGDTTSTYDGDSGTRTVTTASELANWEGTGTVSLDITTTTTSSVTLTGDGGSGSGAGSTGGQIKPGFAIIYYDSTDEILLGQSETLSWEQLGHTYTTSVDQYDGTIDHMDVQLWFDTDLDTGVERTLSTCGQTTASSTFDTWANLYRN